MAPTVQVLVLLLLLLPPQLLMLPPLLLLLLSSVASSNFQKVVHARWVEVYRSAFFFGLFVGDHKKCFMLPIAHYRWCRRKWVFGGQSTHVHDPLRNDTLCVESSTTHATPLCPNSIAFTRHLEQRCRSPTHKPQCRGLRKPMAIGTWA